MKKLCTNVAFAVIYTWTCCLNAGQERQDYEYTDNGDYVLLALELCTAVICFFWMYNEVVEHLNAHKLDESKRVDESSLPSTHSSTQGVRQPALIVALGHQRIYTV